MQQRDHRADETTRSTSRRARRTAARTALAAKLRSARGPLLGRHILELFAQLRSHLCDLLFRHSCQSAALSLLPALPLPASSALPAWALNANALALRPGSHVLLRKTQGDDGRNLRMAHCAFDLSPHRLALGIALKHVSLERLPQRM
jgi:hypothetical protein